MKPGVVIPARWRKGADAFGLEALDMRARRPATESDRPT